MPQGSLCDVVIVEPVVAPQHGIQVLNRVGVGGPQDFADTAIEALHHAIGLGMARRRQMFDGVLLAQLVEGVVAQGLAVLLGEAVGEGLVVVGEQFGDDERGLLLEVLEQPQTSLLGLTLLPLHVDPAAGPVNGDGQVATAVLAGHRRQVLDVDVDEHHGNFHRRAALDRGKIPQISHAQSCGAELVMPLSRTTSGPWRAYFDGHGTNPEG